MKIQLKRSGVAQDNAAKAPTAEQIDYGEIAVNYNSADPALFLKDSDNAVIKITGAGSVGSFDGDYNSLSNKPTIGNGNITISAGNGVTATGDNATANQTGNTTRTLSAKAGDSTILVDSAGIKVQNANIAPEWNNIQNKPGSSSGAALSSGSYLTGGPYDGSSAKTFSVEGTTGATANRLVARDGNGDTFCRYSYGSYMNMSHARATRTNDTIFYSSTDDFIRKTDATGMRSSLNVPTRTGGNASGTWSINVSGSSTSCSGNAATASKLATARNIALSGDLSGSANFDGSANITISAQVANDSHTHDGRYYTESESNSRYLGRTSNTWQTSSDGRERIYFGTNSHTYIKSSNNIYLRTENNNSDNCYIASGSITCVNVNSTSDINKKKDVRTIEKPLELIEKLNGVQFNWKDTGEASAGVIAQDVEKVLPELVSLSQTEDPYKTVDYNGLVGLLVEAVKELKQEVAELKGQLK